MTAKHPNPCKPSYCTRDGHCLSCDLSHECVDCSGKPFSYCKTCGDLVGENTSTCVECWGTAFPGYCWECGEKHGAGYPNGCRSCLEYLKD